MSKLSRPLVRRPAGALRLLPLALTLAACGPDSSGPDTPECGGGTSVTPAPSTAPLGALGLGQVSERFTAEVWVRGTTAYTTTWGHRGVAETPGNEIKIWDVSGNVPAFVDCRTVEGASTLGDVQVSDDGSLLVVPTEHDPGSIVVFDASDARKPRQLSRFQVGNLLPGVHTAEVARVDGKLYAFLSVDPSPPRLVIVDLSTPTAPREVFARQMGTPFIHDVFVRDGLLFTALWNAGLTIWDIGGGGKGGSVTNPVEMGSVRTVGGAVHNVWWLHDPSTGAKRYALIGEEQFGQIGVRSAGDIHVVDVSDLAAPREVAFFNVPGAGTHNFSVDESRGILYAAYYNAGVVALDVRGDLGTCTAEQKAVDGRCNLGLMGREMARGLSGAASVPGADSVYVWGVHYVEPFVYASDMVNGLWKLRAVMR